MTALKKTGSVFGSQWAAVVFSNIIAIIQLVFLTRALGPESFGVYAGYLGVFSIVLVIQEFGVRNLILSVDSVTLHDYRFYEYLLILGLGLAVGLQLGMLLIGYEVGSTVAIGLCALSVSLTSIVSTSLFVHGMLNKDATFKVLIKALVLGGFVVILSFKSRVEYLFIVWAAINILISWFFFRYLLEMRADSRSIIDRASLSSLFIQSRQHLGRAFTFNLVDLASVTYIRFGVITLAYLNYPDASIGVFALALRFPELVIQLLTPVAYAGLLKWKRGPIAIDRLTVIALMIASSAVFASGYFVLIYSGADMIAWIFGTEFQSTIDVLQVVYLALPFMVFNLFAGHVLLARGHSKTMLCFTLVMCCLAYSLALFNNGASVNKWGEILLFCEGLQAFVLFLYVNCFLKCGRVFDIAHS